MSSSPVDQTLVATLRAYLLPAAIVTLITVPLSVFTARAWVGTAGSGTPIDYYVFGPTGADLLTGKWAGVYANPVNQGGPFELATFGIADLLHIHTGTGWVIFYTTVASLLCFATVLILCVVRGTAPRTSSWYFALFICSLVIFASYIPTALFLGHPAEVAIPALWLLAAYFARKRMFLICGLVVALSAGWEVWGVLGAPVVLIVAKPRLVRAALGALAGVVVLFVPFIATGVFKMFGFAWIVESRSLFYAIAPGLTTFPWSLRLLQAVVAVVAGCAVALLARGTRYGIWLVPLAIIAFRLALDPVVSHYYWFAAGIVAVGLLADLIQNRRWALALLAALLVAGLAIPAENFIAAFVIGILTLVAAIVVHVRTVPRELPA
jgi:hypothetical protein